MKFGTFEALRAVEGKVQLREATSRTGTSLSLGIGLTDPHTRDPNLQI